MSVSNKNKALRRMWLPLELLDDNPDNPNVLGDRGFDMLVANVDEVGFTDPVLVWPRGQFVEFEQVLKDAKAAGIMPGMDEPVPDFVEMLKAANIRFMFVGGHHRAQAMQYLGETMVPATVIFDPDFDDDAAEAQLMRNNLIHGKVDLEKFAKMAQRQIDKGLSEDDLQLLYGFADEAEFRKMVATLSKQLPTKDLQDKFKKAAEEIKTIDGLTKLLNKMFALHGDTLPYGYMVVDYGGQHSYWLRASKKTFDALSVISDACLENQVTMDDVLGAVVQSIARGEQAEILEKVLSDAPKVQVPSGYMGGPTKDALEKSAAV